MHLQHLGLLGYGEVGRIFAAGLGAHFASVRVWDIDLRNPAPGVQACIARRRVSGLVTRNSPARSP